MIFDRLAKLFNAAANSVQQLAIEQWIREKFPDLAVKLEAMGPQMGFNNLRTLPMDLPMEP